MAHDWCRLNFSKHQSKFDKTQMYHALGVGYELHASLLIDAETGEPIAPAGLNLLTDKGIYQCRSEDIQPKQSHLDSLFESIQWQEQLRLDKPLVHVIDREADSAKDLRRLGCCTLTIMHGIPNGLSLQLFGECRYVWVISIVCQYRALKLNSDLTLNI